MKRTSILDLYFIIICALVVYIGTGSSICKAETNLIGIEMNVLKILEREEGFRELPYLDHLGFLTVGYGTKLSNLKGLDPEDFVLKVTPDVARLMLHTTVEEFSLRLSASSQGHVFDSLDTARQAVIVSMAYQMGISGVLKFKKMWLALDNKHYTTAKIEALDSRWATQTPERAARHAQVLKQGSFAGIY